MAGKKKKKKKMTQASTHSAFLAWQRVLRAGVRPAIAWITLQTAGQQGQAPVPLASDQPPGSKETLPTSQLASSSTKTTESCLFEARCCYVHLLTMTKQLRHDCSALAMNKNHELTWDRRRSY